MITIRKLSLLPSKTQIRKCVRLLESMVLALQKGEPVDLSYMMEVLNLVLLYSKEKQSSIEPILSSTITSWKENLPSQKEDLLWSLSDIVQLLLIELGIERADWDFYQEDGTLDTKKREIFPCTVILDRLRSPFNIGSIFRSADSFGVENIVLVAPSPSPLTPRSLRSSAGCVHTVSYREVAEEEISLLCANKPLFALELGGTPLHEFSFPPNGTLVVGSEELGVSPALLSLADASYGRISIPLYGTKGSLNVSVAFGIVMHAWNTSLHRR